MADVALYPWQEYLRSLDPIFFLHDVSNQLHIQPSARDDFLLLMWRHTRPHHPPLPHLGYACPTQLLPLIDDFLQRYGWWIWPESNHGFTNRDHLRTTSRYASRGWYNAQVPNGHIVFLPYMSLHGTVRTVFLGAEHGLAFSSLGKLLQVYCIMMLKLSPEVQARLDAAPGTADMALRELLGRGVNAVQQAALARYGRGVLPRFPSIEDGSREVGVEGKGDGGVAEQQQQYIGPAALVTNPWPPQEPQQQQQQQQQQYVDPALWTNSLPQQEQQQQQQYIDQALLMNLGPQQEQLPATGYSAHQANVVAPQQQQYFDPALLNNAWTLQQQMEMSAHHANVAAPQQQSQFQQNGFAGYAQQQQIQYQAPAAPVLQRPRRPSAREQLQTRRARQRGEDVPRGHRALAPLPHPHTSGGSGRRYGI